MSDTIFQKRYFPRYVFPFIGGFLYASGFPMTFAPNFFLFPIIGIALLIFSLGIIHEDEERSLFSQILSLLCFSFPYCMLGYYWIPHTLNEFGDIPFPFNFVLGSLFSLIIVPQFWVFLIGHNLFKKFKFKTSFFVSSNSHRYCLYALVFTFVEYYTPQQFPAHLGHPWLQLSPYLGLAPILGAPFFSFLSYWMALSIIGFFKTRSIDKWFIGVFVLSMVFNIALKLTPLENHTHTNNIRLVQGNIGNYIKVNSEKGKLFAINNVLETFLNLSAKPSTEPIDLVVWPETAFPKLLSVEKMKQNPLYIPKIFKNTIAASGAELFVGGYDKNKYDEYFFESEYNTAFHFTTGAHFKDYYHKMKLIPFGESLPFGPLNRYFSKLISNISFFAQGERYSLFTTKNGTPFTSAICYEILFSSFIKTYLNSVEKQPHFLINITNDSWYGDTAEPYQHLFLAHWRALEFNLPIVRMTNTGITSILFPDGSESKRLGIGAEDILDYKLKTEDRAPTIFQKVGIWGVVLLSLFIYLLMYFVGKFTSKKSPL
ncbi:MAG: apolipoprotein N-acyltransferase [Bacteriovoracaceae bacterium]|nr:apolipoprotein N-acyltransferase [Bacteriovoracaceae bacterium]